MSELGQALFVCGDRSGVGKTSVCIGLLNALSYVYDPSEIAYIKPCTQCESVQLLWKFCHVCLKCSLFFLIFPIKLYLLLITFFKFIIY